MSRDFTDLTQIEAYLNGELDAATQRDFEAALRTNSRLQKEVKAYRTIYEGFQYIQADNFATEVATWTEDLRKKNIVVPLDTKRVQSGTKIRSLYRRISMAASVVLLLGFGTTWWVSSQYSNSALLKQSYQAPVEKGVLGDNQATVTILEKEFNAAHTLFKKEKYLAAETAFQTFLNNLKINPIAFDELTYNYYLENAEWTKILAMVGAEKTADANFKNELETITNNPNHNYSKQAKLLQENLNSFWRKLTIW